MDLIDEGCQKNDVDMVKRGIDGLRLKCGPKDPKILHQYLNTAVIYCSHDVVRYLLDEEKVPVDAVKPRIIRLKKKEPTKMIQILLDRGWDINQSDPPHEDDPCPGRRLMQYIYADDSLIRWLLDHGASAKDPHPDPYISPPILDNIASGGTVSTFELLRSHGAGIGIRTLHRAVEYASLAKPEGRPARMDMVRHLVITLGLDVNALDCEKLEFNHYGTPLCYAVASHGRAEGIGEVVRFLIDHGADPFKVCEWVGWNAISLAKRNNPPVFEIMKNYISYEEDERCRLMVSFSTIHFPATHMARLRGTISIHRQHSAFVLRETGLEL